MPIDADAAVAAPYPEAADHWDYDRVILYQLGLGAGGDPLDERELAYVNERRLKVLPTFSVIPGFEAVRPALANGPGLGFDPSRMLHGEQELLVHHPLPATATVISKGCVESVFDKGKAAIVVLRSDTSSIDGTPLCTNRFRLFIRGEGGFGGDPGPEPRRWGVTGEPDLVVATPTLPQQAAIYRLSGDRNPLHIDPKYAARAGFDRPILHGLCTYGIVCKAIVDVGLDGQPDRVTAWSARFATPVFPGETIVTRAWRSDGEFLVEASVAERNQVVLTHGFLTAD